MAGNHRIKTLQQETDQASPKALCLEDREAVTLGVGSALAKVGPRTCSSQTEIDNVGFRGEFGFARPQALLDFGLRRGE